MAQQSHRLRLLETFRSVFYAPIYGAMAGGFLQSGGLVRERQPYQKVVRPEFAEALRS